MTPMKRFAVPAPVYLAAGLAVLGLLAWFGWTLLGDRTPLTEQGFEYWQRNNPDSVTSVDHETWNNFLSRYVRVSEDGVNRFDYRGVEPEDRARLDAYIATLEQVTVTNLAAAEQLAYWINLYNAVTVRVILDHYPVDSIRDIRFEWPDQGPWKKKLATVEGAALSLDDIEHRIVRPIFADNRAHYALNCASIGCPNLQTRAYTGDNLEAMLESGAREYINHPRGARFDGGALIASSLFDWYEEDFGKNQRQVIEHLMQYAQPPLRERLEQTDAIDGFFYDWSLNDG